MIIKNSNTVFAVPNDQKITVYSSATKDMIQFYKKEPQTIMEKVKAKLNPTPASEVITSENFDQILNDENANIVEMTKPGVVNLGFINEDGTITNGASVHLITTEPHTDDSGFWTCGVSQHKLNEYVLNSGVTQFPQAQTQGAEEMFDSTPCEMEP